MRCSSRPTRRKPARSIPAATSGFALDLDRAADDRRLAGAVAARPVIAQFLDDLWAQTGLTPAQTVLAGFSQGAMMALHTGLSLDRRLAGILAFSGALLPPERISPAAGCCARRWRWSMANSTRWSIPTSAARPRRSSRPPGYDVALHVSPGIGHSISTDGLDFASAFLKRALGS